MSAWEKNGKNGKNRRICENNRKKKPLKENKGKNRNENAEKKKLKEKRKMNLKEKGLKKPEKFKRQNKQSLILPKKKCFYMISMLAPSEEVYFMS